MVKMLAVKQTEGKACLVHVHNFIHQETIKTAFEYYYFTTLFKAEVTAHQRSLT